MSNQSSTREEYVGSEKIRRSAAAAVVVDHLIKSLQLINYTNIVIIWLLCFCFYMPFSVNGSKCRRNPVIFNFGDSNTDNGELAAGVGYTLAPQEGITFFHKPSGRLCDGRLVIDFFCESLNISGYLTPYMESMAPDFRNGVNFGSDGGSLFPRSPFNLVVQVFQFLRFQTRSLELYSQGVEDMLGEEEFNKALYIFDIGQNDLVAALDTLSFNQALKRIPSLISEIEVAMWRIYNSGGRNFWVHNIGPLGCWPQRLGSNNATDYDKHGCFQYLNKGAKEFNNQLNARCEQLRIQMKNAMIVYVDLFAIKYDLIANAAFYGFENPLMACCGNGGPPYNFNPKILCGQKGSKVCKNVSRYISWDGVHYTDAANAFITSKILSTKYSRPPIKFDFFCN